MENRSTGDSSKGRKIVGGCIVVFVWGLFLARLLTGSGPMHDLHGVQSPLWHYLSLAAIVTAMVVTWIVLLRPRS